MLSSFRWIATRFFKAEGNKRVFMPLSLISVFCVAVSIFALIVTFSVMKGFDKELSKRLIGFNSHLLLYAPQGEMFSASPAFLEKKTFAQKNEIERIVSYIEGEVVVTHQFGAENYVQGAKLRGIHSLEDLPSDAKFFNTSMTKINAGELILGDEIAKSLWIHPEFESKVKVLAPQSVLLPTGDLGPNTTEFAVTSLFLTGIYNFDGKYIFSSFEDAVSLLGEQKQQVWQIFLRQETKLDEVTKSLRNILPHGWNVSNWKEQNEKLVSALQFERKMMLLVLSMMLIISSFTIIGVQTLSVTEKRHAAALLKTIGFPDKKIKALFYYRGLSIGVVSVLTAVFCSTVVLILLQKIHLELPSSYYLDYLPSEINIMAIILFSLFGILLSLFSSYYPVKKIFEVHPCEVLRYE